MNATELKCKKCGASLDYKEGETLLRCPNCGAIQKIDESDSVTIERMRLKEKEEEEKRKAEKKKNNARMIRRIVYGLIACGLIALAVFGIYCKGKNYIKQPSEYYVNQNYQVVHRMLEEAGFENIQDCPQKTLTKKEQESIGLVTQVSIDGNPSFAKGWYPKGAAITIYYKDLDPAKENDIQIPISRNDCIGQNYQYIVETFTSGGFYNINVIPYPDLGMDQKNEDGRVTRITVDNSETFFLGDYYAAASTIQIEYHTLDPERKTDVMIPASYTMFENADYLDVCNEFLRAGFTNITLIPNYDLKVYQNTKNGTVERVSVNGNSSFVNGVWVSCDSEVRIAYHTKEIEYLGKNYEEIVETLVSMGFVDVINKPLNDLSVHDLKKEGEVASVTIGDLELSDATELNLLTPIVVKYHSERQATSNEVRLTVAPKDLIGNDYSSVYETLKEMGFTNIKTVALKDLWKEILHKDGEVKEVSIDGVTKFSSGEIFNKNVEVIITYHSLKSN